MKTAATWLCWRDAKHTVNQTMFGWPQCFECGAAPEYHERWQYVRDDFVVGIYVLEPGPLNAIIEPRSAVVGLHNGGDGDESRTEVYFEGFVHGQYADLSQRERWTQGIKSAAGRMVCRYPTIASCLPRTSAVKAVGMYQVKADAITIDDEQTLAQWLEGP